MSHADSSHPADSVLGTLCLVAGAAVGVLVLAVRLEGAWEFPASLIRRNPVLMSGFAVALMFGGARLLWRSRTVETSWTPTLPGRRFRSAVLYVKEDCPLCEEAINVLEPYQAFLPPIQPVDVSDRPEKQKAYADCVPVLELDGRKRFVGQINEVLLRRLLEGTRPAVLILAALIALTAVGSPSASAEDRVEQNRAWLVGRRLQQELEKPVNIVRSRSTVRDVVRRIRELHEVALLVDRRIDPDRSIDVQLVQTSLGDGLALWATQLEAELVTIGGTLYIGPVDVTDKIRTLIALRTREVREDAEFQRLSELLQGTSLAWEDLAEPVELLDRVQTTFRCRALNPEAVPHDLWGRGAMADVNAVEALLLVLGQFDLSFEWQPGADSVRIVSMPASVVVEQSHTSRTMSVDDAVALVRKTWPDLQPTRRGRSVVVAGTAGQHDAIQELLNPPAQNSKSTPPTQGPLTNRLFTLTTTRTEAIVVIRTLELEGTKVEYDSQALEQAGVDLRRKLTLKLEKATADEFFTAVCEPLGLTYELDGTTVRLTPK